MNTKIEKVAKLIRTSEVLDIFYDGIFDDLMDKYEKNRDLFEYMYNEIKNCVSNNTSKDLITKKFKKLLMANNIYAIQHCDF